MFWTAISEEAPRVAVFSNVCWVDFGGDEALVRQRGLMGTFLMRMGEGVDRETLASVAEITHGQFRMAEDADSLKAVYAEIDKLERTEIEAVRYMDYRELFRPWVLAALVLIGLDVFLRCTVLRKIP